MKQTTIDLLILEIWRSRAANSESEKLFPTLISCAGDLARNLLQGQKAGYSAAKVATVALRIYEEIGLDFSSHTDNALRPYTIQALSEEIKRCRAKFPKNDLMLAALTEELGELAGAFVTDSDSNAAICRKEALQVACVAVRILEEGDATFANATEASLQP